MALLSCGCEISLTFFFLGDHGVFGWKKFDVRRENQGLGLLLCFREQLVEPETICVIAFTLFKAQWDFFLINAVPICECDLNFAL